MVREDLLGQIKAVATRVAHGYDLEIFDVQLRREPIGWVLRIIIDQPSQKQKEDEGSGAFKDTVTIAECAKISTDVGAILDVEDIISQNYTLEVSSPGLDRPLRNLNDYRRFSGRLAKVVMSEAVNGQKYMAGRIRGVEDGVLIIEEGKRTHRIPVPLITKAHLKVEF